MLIDSMKLTLGCKDSTKYGGVKVRKFITLSTLNGKNGHIFYIFFPYFSTFVYNFEKFMKRDQLNSYFP